MKSSCKELTFSEWQQLLAVDRKKRNPHKIVAQNGGQNSMLSKNVDVMIGCGMRGGLPPVAQVPVNRYPDVGSRPALFIGNRQEGLHPARSQREHRALCRGLLGNLLQRPGRPGHGREAGQENPPRRGIQRGQRVPVLRLQAFPQALHVVWL